MTPVKKILKHISVYKIHRPTIAVMSRAGKVKGQGVGSAYEEQLALVKDRLDDTHEIIIHPMSSGDITRYRTINFRYFFHALIHKKKNSESWVG